MDPVLVETLTRTDPQVVGERLKAARKSAGLTQPQMGGGEASTAYISRIERGERRVSPQLLELFCRRIGVTPQSVLGGVDPDEARRLELELDYADLSLVTGDAPAALERARAVADSAEGVRHPHLQVRAQLVCAHASAAMGDYDAAEYGLRRYLESEPTQADWPIAATTLSRVLRETGDLAGSATVARSALDRLDGTELAGTEEPIRLAVTLAASLYELGDVDQARALCEQAIDQARSLESPRARASAYWNASVIETEAGNLDRAVTLARNALTLLENVETSRNLARLRTQLAEILLRTDPPSIESAVQLLRHASTDYQWTDSSEADRLQNSLVLARAELMQGNVEEAAAQARAVLRTGTPLPFPAVAAHVLLGQVAWAVERHDEARDHYVSAVRVLTGIGADREAAQMWFDLGNLLGEAGMHEHASDAFRRSAASTGLTGRPSIKATPAVGTPTGKTPGST